MRLEEKFREVIRKYRATNENLSEQESATKQTEKVAKVIHQDASQQISAVMTNGVVAANLDGQKQAVAGVQNGVAISIDTLLSQEAGPFDYARLKNELERSPTLKEILYPS